MNDLATLAALDAEIYAEMASVGMLSDATHRARGSATETPVQAMVSAGYQVAGEYVQLGAETRTARLLRSQIVATADDELMIAGERWRLARVLNDDGSAVVWQIEPSREGDIP